jgi:hypothetical protein
VCHEGSSNAGAEQILLQKTQTRLASSGNLSEQQSKSGAVAEAKSVAVAEAPKLKAYKVPLSEEGYKAIAKLKDEREMGVFVKRVADELGYKIADEGSLNGVVPYYSGKKATQSFFALTAELSKTAKQRKGWAKKASLAATPNDSTDQILLQESGRVVSHRPRASLMDSGKMTAEEVPLNENGYETMVELRDDSEMAHFIKRVAEELGYEIADVGSLSGVVPYYSGKKAKQSFVALTAELGRTLKARKGWAKKAHSTPAIAAGEILLQKSHEVIAKSNSSTSKPKHTSSPAAKPKVSLVSEKKLKAMNAPLTEEGYKMIAKLKDDLEMSLFVKRVADELGYEISDVGSLNGVVPYYSGKKATQSFMALKNEFSRTAKQAKGWARKAGEKTNDKKPMKTAMIEKRDATSKKDDRVHEVRAAHTTKPKQGKVSNFAAKARKKKA